MIAFPACNHKFVTHFTRLLVKKSQAILEMISILVIEQNQSFTLGIIKIVLPLDHPHVIQTARVP